jgi:hypothetical protein
MIPPPRTQQRKPTHDNDDIGATIFVVVRFIFLTCDAIIFISTSKYFCINAINFVFLV